MSLKTVLSAVQLVQCREMMVYMTLLAIDCTIYRVHTAASQMLNIRRVKKNEVKVIVMNYFNRLLLESRSGTHLVYISIDVYTLRIHDQYRKQ